MFEEKQKSFHFRVGEGKSFPFLIIGSEEREASGASEENLILKGNIES
jgi:hypothetical protein